MTCERCGVALVGDNPCACVFRGYLFEALLKSRKDAAGRPQAAAQVKPGADPGFANGSASSSAGPAQGGPPAEAPVAGPSAAESSGLVRSFVPPLGPYTPTVAADGSDVGPGDWPEELPPGASALPLVTTSDGSDLGSAGWPAPRPTGVLLAPPIASGDPFAPGGLLAPGGPFRPPVTSSPGFGDAAGLGYPRSAGWVGEPTPATHHRPSLRVNRHWLRVTIAVGATMALLLGVLGAYVQLRPRQTYPSQWDPRVAGIVQFVEQTRGLKFIHPVAVDFLPEAQFKVKVGAGQAPTAKKRADLQHTVGELRALGLIQGDADLAAMDKQLTEQSVIGLYVPEDKRVYVRGSDLTPDVRVTLAHELTHALQDQHVDLQRLLHLPNADSSAVRALVEGDAMRVENAYTATMSAEDKATYGKTSAAQASGADLKGISQVLIDGASFPYVFGPVFVKALVASGGTAAIDHALANPPTVDAQVVDPNRYLIQTDVATVAVPALGAGNTRLSPPSTFGQVGMLEVVGAAVGYQVAWSALQNWRGDEAVDYLHSGQACIAIASAFDSPEHAAAFAVVAQRWVAGRDGATVGTMGSTVELRSCDPGPAATIGPVASPTPFEALSLRSAIIGDLIDKAKAPADVAGCIADQVISTVGPPALLAQAASGVTTASIAQASAQAAKTCGLSAP